MPTSARISCRRPTKRGTPDPASHPNQNLPRRPNLMRYSQLAIASAFLCLLGRGCIFSPHKGTGGGTPPPVYFKPFSPDAVLQNLALAYKHRDPAAYDTLFDEFYMGSSIDQSNPDSVKQYTFAKADEVRHIW